MKKILPILIGTLLALPLLVGPTVVLSGTPPEAAPMVEIMPALTRITNWVFAILMIVAVIMIIVGGFHFVTAAGDETMIKRGKTMLTYAIAGIIVALLARGLVAFIRMIVGAPAAPPLP
ncbi:MAG: pilin [Candidatus Nealsonbacteria bacterium]|nr:pilin [Candidatus Nealsonbacteria bacterium]